MSDSSSPSRCGGSKVRTGCITCKARRVKCGEEKPSCKRCLKGKRKCEGYAPTFPRGRRNPDGTLIMINYAAPTKSPSPSATKDMQEQRCYEFFRSRTAAQFAGVFSSDLWSKLLPRMFQHESAVRHAVIALGALHEGFEKFGSSSGSQEYAIQHYGKAIHKVVNLDVRESEISADLALVSCLLFTAFEAMQGHYHSAMTHASSGIKILVELENSNYVGAYMPREVIRSAFLQYDTQFREIGDVSLGPMINLPWKAEAPPPAFETLDDAKQWIEVYLRWLIQFLTGVGTGIDGRNKEEIGAIMNEYAELMPLYQQWCVACDPFDEEYVHSAAQKGRPWCQAYAILRLWRVTIYMLLNMDMAMGEMAWDVFDKEFQSLISWAQVFVDNMAESSTASAPCETFCLSIGIIAPLYVAASRCRNPSTRRQACKLLRECNRSESVWNSTLAARVGERLIELEEGGIDGEISNASQVPLECRVLGMDILFGPNRHGTVKYYLAGPPDPMLNGRQIMETMRW